MKLAAQLSLDRYGWAETILCQLLTPGSLVADIGCSNARWKKLIQEDLRSQWHGYDILPQSPEVIPWNLDLPCPDTSLTFDAALILDVVEHLENPALGLRHVAAVLRQGGHLLLTMPNPGWSRSRWELVCTGYLTCFTPGDLKLNHHVFTPWPHIVEQVLRQNGLEPITYVTLDGATAWPKPVSLRFPLQLLSALGNKFIEWRDPSACGMSYAVLARKTNLVS